MPTFFDSPPGRHVKKTRSFRKTGKQQSNMLATAASVALHPNGGDQNIFEGAAEPMLLHGVYVVSRASREKYPERRSRNKRSVPSRLPTANVPSDGFLPAKVFTDLDEKVETLNSYASNAFDIGTLTFENLRPTPPSKPKRNSRYDVRPRHPARQNHKKVVRRQYNRQEETLEGSDNSSKMSSENRLEKLRRMQKEQDRLSRKKTELRNRRMKRKKEKEIQRLELEARERAGIKLQSLARGRRDRLKVKRMRKEKEEREEREKSCLRIQALHRGKQTRSRLQDDRDRDYATRRIQSVHRGRIERKKVKERKNRLDATRKIQAVQRGRVGRIRAAKQKNELKRELATRKIQAVHRGRKGRQQAKTLADESQEREQADAARKIQARIRGRIHRKELVEQSNAARKIQARIRGLQQRRKMGHALVAGATHPEGVRLVAMLDFDAEEEDDLELRQGDILIGYSLEEGWWSGIKEGGSKVGDFPANYVVREGEESEYELEVNHALLSESGMETKQQALKVEETKVKIAGDKAKSFAEMPLQLKEWALTFRINGLDELARGLDLIGVSDVEDLKDLDDEMIDEVCLSMKRLDAKKFRRAVEGERGDYN